MIWLWITLLLLAAVVVHDSRVAWLRGWDLVTLDKRLRVLEQQAGLGDAWRDAVKLAEGIRQNDRALGGRFLLPVAAYIEWPPTEPPEEELDGGTDVRPPER